jgi:Cft2 family RNA processing exonuclease
MTPLDRVLVAVAAIVIERRFPGQRIDAGQFAAQNRTALLAALAQSRELRALCRETAGSHPLLEEAAASGKPRAPTDRRARNAEKQLARTKIKLDRTRGRLDNAESALDRARAERDAAIGDRDEALTVIESLRAELAAARAVDVQAAARLLEASLRPPSAEPDLREQDRTGTVAVPGDQPAKEPVAEGPVAEALAIAGLDPKPFLAALTAITSPPVPPAAPAPTVVTHAREISVTPLGGGTEIGGSCLLVEVADVRILVDAGTRPRPSNSDVGPPDIEVATAGPLDAIVLTHAHNDHSGYVPALIARYPHLPVYCTADTAALLPTMWGDAVKVFERAQEQRAAYGDRQAQPAYRQGDAFAARHRIRELAYGRVVEVADGVTIELFPAGHILGAAGVVVTAGSSRVVITGDVSDLAQASVPGLVVPEAARQADLLVIESTYCRPGGKPRDQEVERFVRSVAETATAGRVLVPAFALGRAQEVLLILRDRLPDVPVLVDGMAKEVSRIYEARTAGTDRPLRIYGDNVTEVRPGSRYEQYIAMRRGVIVTTSGMLAAGPALQWARWILPDPSSALLVSGYQDEESPGRRLLDLAEGNRLTFNLDGQEIEVKANVAEFRLSAHAGRTGLTSIIRDIAPQQTMLVHGVASAQQEFAGHLHRNGFRTVPTQRWKNHLTLDDAWLVVPHRLPWRFSLT